MSKLKVGDWVCLEQKKVVGRVKRIDGAGIHMYTGKPLDRVFLKHQIDLLTKIPIKFKPFDVVLRPVGEQMRWDIARAPKKIKYTHFACVIVDGKFHVGINPAKGKYLSADFPTIEEAKDWLEHQYATMLAKARGLV